MKPVLPVGKIPPELLERIIQSSPTRGPRVLLGPGIGMDCAVLDFAGTSLVLKTDPITFASEHIGWYAVQIASNDIATTGAVPTWAMFTILLPEGRTTEQDVLLISEQLAEACREAELTHLGGHTEITHNLDRPIVVTTLLAEIPTDQLITPSGAQSGDVLILTKGIPIEATALLAREFPSALTNHLSPDELQTAQNYLYEPGISVLRDAQIAIQAGKVTAMHDPTEGGVATALWEMARASQKTLLVDPERIHIPALSAKICQIFGLDPLGTIASGALLLTADPESTMDIISALQIAGINAVEIGLVIDSEPQVLMRSGGSRRRLPRFDRDEIGRVYESFSPG